MIELYRTFTYTNPVRSLVVGAFWSALVLVVMVLSAPRIVQSQPGLIDSTGLVFVLSIGAVAVVNVFLYPVAREIYVRGMAAVSEDSSESVFWVRGLMLFALAVAKILLSLLIWLTALPVGVIAALFMTAKVRSRARLQHSE